MNLSFNIVYRDMQILKTSNFAFNFNFIKQSKNYIIPSNKECSENTFNGSKV
jgi:hypothetical protein